MYICIYIYIYIEKQSSRDIAPPVTAYIYCLNHWLVVYTVY